MTADQPPTAALRVCNSGAELLELVLEPYGSDHWLLPGETFVVWTLEPAGDEILEIEHAPGTVTVHSEVSAYVGDTDGNEIECGHNRPRPAESTGPAALFRLRLP